MSSSSRTLRVIKLPLTAKDSDLEEAFADFGALKRCFVVKKKDADAADTLGYVEFALAEDADICVNKTQGQILLNGQFVFIQRVPDKGQQANVEASAGSHEKKDFKQMRTAREEAKKKKARLIVRNLAFSAEVDDVRAHFSTCGQVVDVNVLTRPSGQRVGCAFVQFHSVAQAAAAIKKLNGSEIKARTVAVDWAVGKREYQQAKQEQEVKEEHVSEDEEQAQEQDDVKPEIKEEVKTEEVDHEDDDDDVEDEEENKEEDEDEDDGSEEDEHVRAKKPKEEKKWHDLETGHDVGEGLTVFLRNLSFDSSQEDLQDMMVENFGPIYFARLVVDKVTERPRGTAFVKFRERSAAEAALEASAGEDGVWLDGRRVYVVAAMAKTDAEAKKAKEKEREKKDSRNLHLAVEGLVRKGTKAAEGVSETDMALRERVERWKRQMLKDLNAYISPVRLCLRNLPESVDDRKLKKLAAEHSRKQALIAEAKVIRDLRSDKKASKGYGFVAFEKHEDALNLLRQLNNNPIIFGKNTRPVVEFSVENRKAVNARRKRLEKSVENNPNAKNKKGKNTSESKFERKKEKDVLEEKPDFMGSVNNPKVSKLPSHAGAKVRHNPRPQQKAISRKTLKKERKLRTFPKEKQVENEPQEVKKAKKEKKKKGKKGAKAPDAGEEKAFSEMVAKYKRKFNAVDYQPAKKAKWFE